MIRAYEELEQRVMLSGVTVQVPLDGFFLEDLVDPPNEPATLISGPTDGRGDVLPSGVVGFAPDIGFHGPVTMVVGRTGADDLTITFIVGNQSPDAVDDSYTTTINTPILQSAPGMLANDTDPDGDPLTARIETQPSHGMAMAYSSGLFLYWPNEGFVGNDQFTYAAIDPWGNEDIATVSVDVTAPSTTTQTYEITNTGTVDLVLTTGPSLIRVAPSTAAPAAEVIPPGESRLFDVTFAADEPDLQIRTATLTATDMEGRYTFSVQGIADNGERIGQRFSTSIPRMTLPPDAVDEVFERSYWSPLPLASEGLGLDLLPELLADLGA